MDMSSHGDHGSSSSHTEQMQVTFFSSTHTPLYSLAWQPTTTGGYAGSCLFLILLAALFRIMLAGKQFAEHKWRDRAQRRRYIKVEGLPTEAEKIDSQGETEYSTLLSQRGIEERVKVIKAEARPTMPWRLSVDLPRAAITTSIAGVSYLLMLAVMTLNVGYFLSILGGIFIGELAAGRYIESSAQ